MATFKAIVRSSYRRQDGTYRIYIRVTHNRAHRDMPTPFYVTQEQVTRGFKLKDQTIIDKLEDRIKELRHYANTIGFVGERLDIDHYIQLLTSQNETIDFLEFWRCQIKDMEKEGRDGTVTVHECALRKLKAFNKDKPLYFSDITSDFCKRYFQSLSGLKANTQRLYMNSFRAIYRKAQKTYNNSDVDITVVRHGVFDHIELPKRETAKENVFKTIEDMQAVINVPYSGIWSYDFAKDMFILAFVCFGTNMADFFSMKKEQYKDGMLYYRRKKTGRQSGDSVDMQIKVPEVGKIILDKYSGDSKYLINFKGHSRRNYTARYIHYTFIQAGLEDMPKNMDTIGAYRSFSKFTFNANRHSMASYARNICKVEYMTVHEMLNHATPSNFKTTDAYLWKDFTSLWEANDKLLSLFDWSFYLNQKNN